MERSLTIMRRLIIVYLLLIVFFVIFVYQYQSENENDQEFQHDQLKGAIEETYVMITYQSGMDYWKRQLKGFEDAAESLNVSVEYRGTTHYDTEEMIALVEQIIAKKPAGIAIAPINKTAINTVINKATEAGIPVVLFDTDAPESNADAFVGTDNYYAGSEAAHQLAEYVDFQGQVAVMKNKSSDQDRERVQGFKDAIEQNYPNIQLVHTGNGDGDETISKEAMMRIIEDFPELKGVFATEAASGIGVAQAIIGMERVGETKIISFNIDKPTIDFIDEGVITGTLSQSFWGAGYWSMQLLFHLEHDLLLDNSGTVNIPKYVDTGINVITKENVNNYYMY